MEADGDVAVGTTTGSAGTVTEYTPIGSATGRSFSVGHEPYRLLLSRDGNALYIADRQLGELYAVDTSLFAAAIGSYGSIGDPTQLAVTPDGLTLFVAGRRGRSRAQRVSLLDRAGHPDRSRQRRPQGGPGHVHRADRRRREPGRQTTPPTRSHSMCSTRRARWWPARARPRTRPPASHPRRSIFRHSPRAPIPCAPIWIRPWAPQVLVTATGFKITAAGATLAATGSEPLVPSVIAGLLLLGGAAVLVVRRRRTA